MSVGSAGDIRVGIEYKECPRVMTVVGVQNDDIIMPVRKVSGTYAIATPLNVTADELLDELVLQEGGDLTNLRLICGVGVFVGMFVMVGNFIPFRVLLLISCKLVCPSLGTLCDYCRVVHVFCLFGYLDCLLRN